MDNEDLVIRVMIAVVALALLGLLVASGFEIARVISREQAQDACGARGGTVEHFDPHHDEAWRCVGARPEAQ